MRGCVVDLNPFVRCAGRLCTCAVLSSSGGSIAQAGCEDGQEKGVGEADDDDGGGGGDGDGAAAASGQPVGLI